MSGTLLVETLLESTKLQQLLDALPRSANTEDIEKRIADYQAIVEYLKARFVEHNLPSGSGAANSPRIESRSEIDLGESGRELVGMNNLSLLRYGTALKYVCFAEPELLEQSFDQSRALLFDARAEWRRRFALSSIADSI